MRSASLHSQILLSLCLQLTQLAQTKTLKIFPVSYSLSRCMFLFCLHALLFFLTVYRLMLAPDLIQEGTLRFELNPLCSEVAEGMANLFSLSLKYKLTEENGSADIMAVKTVFRDNGFDVEYGDIEATFEMTLYYMDFAVEKFRHSTTVKGINI